MHKIDYLFLIIRVGEVKIRPLRPGFAIRRIGRELHWRKKLTQPGGLDWAKGGEMKKEEIEIIKMGIEGYLDFLIENPKAKEVVKYLLATLREFGSLLMAGAELVPLELEEKFKKVFKLQIEEQNNANSQQLPLGFPSINFLMDGIEYCSNEYYSIRQGSDKNFNEDFDDLFELVFYATEIVAIIQGYKNLQKIFPSVKVSQTFSDEYNKFKKEADEFLKKLVAIKNLLPLISEDIKRIIKRYPKMPKNNFRKMLEEASCGK